MNSNPQSIMLLNSNYEITSCNKAAAKMFKPIFGRILALRENFLTLLSETDSTNFATACNKAIKGKDSSAEYHIPQKNAGSYAVTINISYMVNSNSRQGEISLTMAETAPLNSSNPPSSPSEKLIKAIFNIADIGIALIDNRNKFVKINDGLCSLLGFTQEELAGKSYLTIIAPAERKDARRLLSKFLAGENETLERVVICKDGRAIYCNVTNNLFVDDNGNKLLVKTIRNISENRKYKELLRQTARLTKTGGFELDVLTNDITWTEEMYKIYEVAGDIKPGLEEVRSLYDEETKAMVKRTVDNAIATGERYEIEFKFITVTNREKWLRVTGIPVIEQSKVRKIIGTVQDITVEKKAELQVQRLSLVASKTNNAVIITGPCGKIEWVNDSFVELTGYEMAEALGKKPGQLLQGPGTDNAAVNRMSIQLSKLLPVSEVIKNYRKDGTEFWINMSITPVFENEKLVNFIGLGIDITEMLAARELKTAQETLKQQLQLFRAIGENFPDGLIGVLNKELNYVYVGGTEIEKLGMSPKLLIGQHIFDTLSEEGNAQAEPFLKRAFAGENVLFEMDVRENTYLINAVPLHTGKEAGDQILIVLYNITKRKQAEEEARLALAKQRELGELKSKFVTIASHEFRTPLSVILSSTDLLLKYSLSQQPDKVNRHVERIRVSIGALTEMLNDFLSLEKIEEGKVANNITEFGITEFCESLVEEIKVTLKKGQTLTYEHIGNKANIALDKQQLKHVLINILGNAGKYSGEGKNISLMTSVTAEKIQFIVKDEGIGIPAEDQPNLFQTFFRANNVTNIQGTGMGLHIVKRYLDIMGGI